MDAGNIVKVQCPIAIEWPISESRLRELQPGEYLNSEVFDASNIPGVKYGLMLYPKGYPEKCLGQSFIAMGVSVPIELKIEANFELKIEAANFSKKLKCVYDGINVSGYGKRFERTEKFFDPANGYILDGELIVKMQGVLTVEKEMEKMDVGSDDHQDALGVGLWNQEEGKNFRIVVEGKEIMAHKSVLATRSPVFARMFSTDMVEARDNKVEIKDFAFKIVEMGIKLCYHYSLATELSLDAQMQLLLFFDKYNMQSLKNDLEAFLICQISESTVCRLTNTSLLGNSSKLTKQCSEFLRSCFGKKPVSDLALLDNHFAANLFKDSFYHVSK